MSAVMDMLMARAAINHRSAGAGPTLVQMKSDNGVASGAGSITMDSAPVSGNTLVALWTSSNSVGVSAPAGWNALQNVAFGGSRFCVFEKTSDGTESTITMPSTTGSSNFAVLEYQGAVTITLAEFGNTTQAAAAVTIGPMAAPAQASIPVMRIGYIGASPDTQTWPTGWTSDGPHGGANPYRGGSVAYAAQTSAGVSAVTINTVARGNGSAVQWQSVWIAP